MVRIPGSVTTNSVLLLNNPAQNDDAIPLSYLNSQNYLTTTSAIDHHTLTDLTGHDDHTQYLLTTGQRATDTGNVSLNGELLVNNTTASSSSTTGSITTAGGAGIGGALNVGGNANVTGNLAATGSSTLTSLTTTGLTQIQSTTASTSTSTGALVVTGGEGIGGALNVGGNVAITGTLTVGGVAVNPSSSTGTWQTFNTSFTGQSGLFNYAVQTNTGTGEYYVDGGGYTHLKFPILVTGSNMTGASGNIFLVLNSCSPAQPSTTATTIGPLLYGTGYGFIEDGGTFLKGMNASVYYQSATEIGIYVQTVDASAIASNGTLMVIQMDIVYK